MTFYGRFSIQGRKNIDFIRLYKKNYPIKFCVLPYPYRAATLQQNRPEDSGRFAAPLGGTYSTKPTVKNLYPIF